MDEFTFLARYWVGMAGVTKHALLVLMLIVCIGAVANTSDAVLVSKVFVSNVCEH